MWRFTCKDPTTLYMFKQQCASTMCEREKERLFRFVNAQAKYTPRVQYTANGTCDENADAFHLQICTRLTKQTNVKVMEWVIIKRSFVYYLHYLPIYSFTFKTMKYITLLQKRTNHSAIYSFHIFIYVQSITYSYWWTIITSKCIYTTYLLKIFKPPNHVTIISWFPLRVLLLKMTSSNQHSWRWWCWLYSQFNIFRVRGHSSIIIFVNNNSPIDAHFLCPNTYT